MAGFNKNFLAKMVLVAIGMDGALASFKTLKGVKHPKEVSAEAKMTIEKMNQMFDNPTHDSEFLNKAGFASRRLAQRTSDQNRESNGPFQPAVLEDNHNFLGNQELSVFPDLKSGQVLSSQIPVQERPDDQIGIEILDDENKPVSFQPNKQLANDHQIDPGKSKHAFELRSLAEIIKDGYDEEDDEFIQAERVANLEEKLKGEKDSKEIADINAQIAKIKKQYNDDMLIAEAKAKKMWARKQQALRDQKRIEAQRVQEMGEINVHMDCNQRETAIKQFMEEKNRQTEDNAQIIASTTTKEELLAALPKPVDYEDANDQNAFSDVSDGVGVYTLENLPGFAHGDNTMEGQIAANIEEKKKQRIQHGMEVPHDMQLEHPLDVVHVRRGTQIWRYKYWFRLAELLSAKVVPASGCEVHQAFDSRQSSIFGANDSSQVQIFEQLRTEFSNASKTLKKHRWNFNLFNGFKKYSSWESNRKTRITRIRNFYNAFAALAKHTDTDARWRVFEKCVAQVRQEQEDELLQKSQKAAKKGAKK
jgi:hypothetical protein